MKEVMDSAAVIIYHEILKAIKDNNLVQAVKYIGEIRGPLPGKSRNTELPRSGFIREKIFPDYRRKKPVGQVVIPRGNYHTAA